MVLRTMRKRPIRARHFAIMVAFVFSVNVWVHIHALRETGIWLGAARELVNSILYVAGFLFVRLALFRRGLSALSHAGRSPDEPRQDEGGAPK